MAAVDRSLFVARRDRTKAFEDNPLPIASGQTISQPYIVAYMAEALQIQPEDKVLEIGSGSGYHAAVVAQLANAVFSLEIIPELSQIAAKNLAKANIENVELRNTDGYFGLPEKAPFDKIYLTAAAPDIPQPLKEQLVIGGLLLAPVQKHHEQLALIKKTAPDQFETKILLPVRFVPMTGKVQGKKK